MFFLSLLLLAAPHFRVVAYPNAEYIGRPNFQHNQISSHNLLKPRDSQDSLLPFNIPTFDFNIPEQSPSSINEDSTTGVSPGQATGTDYTNQDDNQDLVSPDLQAQACAAGSTRTNGKLRRGLSCAIRTPVGSTPQAPSKPKAPEAPEAPEENPGVREDIQPPGPPSAPSKPLPLLIDKETGQVELDLGPEFAPIPKFKTNGPCALKTLLCCSGQLPVPFGNVENCWPCMSWALRKGNVLKDLLTRRKVNLMISFCLDQDNYYCCSYHNVSELDPFFWVVNIGNGKANQHSDCWPYRSYMQQSS